MKVMNFKDYVNANEKTIIGATVGVTVGLIAIIVAYKVAYKRGTLHGVELVTTCLEKTGESGITITGRCYDGVIRTVNYRAKVID